MTSLLTLDLSKQFDLRPLDKLQLLVQRNSFLANLLLSPTHNLTIKFSGSDSTRDIVLMHASYQTVTVSCERSEKGAEGDGQFAGIVPVLVVT